MAVFRCSGRSRGDRRTLWDPPLWCTSDDLIIIIITVTIITIIIIDIITIRNNVYTAVIMTEKF